MPCVLAYQFVEQKSLSMSEEEFEQTPSSQGMDVHPLLLDIILDKVLETLSVQQLLLCRLVCRAWCRNSALKNKIRSRSVVNLRTVFLHTSVTSENVGNYFQNGDSIYSFCNFEDICYHNCFISKFFRDIGPTIKSLKLLLSLQQLNIDQFRELIYERVPNLEELNIYNLSYAEIYSKPLLGNDDNKLLLRHANLTKLQLQETRAPIIEFMSSFLETLPNLHEISLKVGICRDWIEQADLWRENSAIATSVAKALLASGAFKSLKVFRCGKLRKSHLECFLEMGKSGLQLEVLQLHVPHKESEDVFTEFLNSQRNCLKELILFEQRSARYKKKSGGPGGHQNFILRLPDIMSELELLQLSKHYKSVIVPLLPVDFSLQCPKLKRLIFLGQCPDEGDTISLATEKNTKISEVVLWSRVHHANTATDLGQYSNLTKLHVRYPNSEFLLAMWDACDKLQHLTFIFEEGSFVDDGMTGNSENVIGEWLAKDKLADKDTEVSRIDENYDNQQNANEIKSIVNLKGLRTLKITVEHNEDSERQAISDATVNFSLRKLTQLRYLELYTSDWRLGHSECKFISKKWQNALKKELELTVVHFAPPGPYD